MTYARHTDALWALIREDYLDGHTKERLAAHYHVGESTIRDRARREGWRRCDQPAPDIGRIEDAADDEDDYEPMRPVVEVIADAYRRADVAFQRGRLVDAQRCLSIARSFEALHGRRGPLATALNEHWRREAEDWAAGAPGLDDDVDAPLDPPQPPNPPSPPDPPCVVEDAVAEYGAGPPPALLLDPPDRERPVAEQIALLQQRAERRLSFGLPAHDVRTEIEGLQAYLASTASPSPARPANHSPP
jgi:hypothetical protein